MRTTTSGTTIGSSGQSFADASRRRSRFDLANTISFSVMVEVGTAVALLIAPATVERWLLGTGFTDVVVGRAFGIALLALGLACWPTRERSTAQAFRAMLVYNVLATLYLLFLGVGGESVGPLLWPAAGAHALLTIWCSAVILRPATLLGRTA